MIDPFYWKEQELDQEYADEQKEIETQERLWEENLIKEYERKAANLW